MSEQIAKRKSIMGWLFVAFAVMMKSTKIIAALKLLKFGKPLVTVISLAISAVAYGIWLGPWFGIGLVAMLFIHEMGHVIALRMKGMETPGPVFIPFLGAAIFVPSIGDRDTEAFVGYGGPLLGTIGAVLCFAAWYATGQTSEILLLVSYVGIFLNIFNLIPVSPLDGGRITQAVGGWFKYVGLALLLGYTFAARQPALLLIWILVLDGFDKLPLWTRPSIASMMGVGMAVLMLLGYSEQPFWIDVLDCGLAALFIFVFAGRDAARKNAADDETEVDNRAYPAKGVRAKWLCYYLGLAIVTSSIIAIQIQHLPHGVKSHSEQLTSPPPVQVQ